MKLRSQREKDGLTGIFSLCRMVYWWVMLVGVLAGCHPPTTPRLTVTYSTSGNRLELECLWLGREPAWSPDGRYIAYVRTGIWIADPQGGNRRQLTKSGEQPAWSPDSQSIAYADNGIRVIGIAGGEGRLLVAVGSSPSWSANGEKLFYVNQGIWVIELSTTRQKQILPVKTAMTPRPLPKSGALLFEQFDPKQWKFDLWYLELGKPPKLLLDYAQSPAISPDGRRLVYAGDGIWLARLDGSQKERLTVAGSYPSWSPDGKKIIFYFQDHLWTMDSPYESNPAAFEPESLSKSPDPL